MNMKLPTLKNRKTKKSPLVLLLAIVLVLAVSVAFTGSKPLAVNAVTAEAAPVKTWFSETGTVIGGEEYQVYTAVSGNVSQVYVEKGQYVEAGAVIAQLDTAAYQAEIAIHQANIKSYQAEGSLNAQGISVEQLQLQVDYSQGQLNTYTRLYDEGAISRNEYEGYEQDHVVLNSSLQQANSQRSGTTTAYSALAESEQAAINLLQTSIQNCTITADRAGYITQLPIASQSYVQAQTTVCVIQDQQGLRVETYVATEDIGAVQRGDRVELVQELRQGEVAYTGTVTEIGQWAEDQVSSLGVSEQRVKVVIAPDEELLAAASGYRLTVRFISFTSDSAIALPKSAFFENGGLDYVFVTDAEQRLQAVAVEKGVTAQGRTVALSGVEAGDIVVEDAAAEGIAEGVLVSW